MADAHGKSAGESAPGARLHSTYGIYPCLLIEVVLGKEIKPGDDGETDCGVWRQDMKSGADLSLKRSTNHSTLLMAIVALFNIQLWDRCCSEVFSCSLQCSLNVLWNPALDYGRAQTSTSDGTAAPIPSHDMRRTSWFSLVANVLSI